MELYCPSSKLVNGIARNYTPCEVTEARNSVSVTLRMNKKKQDEQKRQVKGT